ncbi:Helix-turn-helix protein [Streptomyces sp. S4.7]|uniref:helix-turn-helix domain-containing protein n=1 Tax=Streptomyces sp. S4.7 TaxID=2705439 RepID=UPI001398284E|nr:helix-turn-helix domain-containing protein [Streptomyces sp. S4.7]QHY99228.1 Helix-turn-helix protein [Streptomyces sp. S4.7]
MMADRDEAVLGLSDVVHAHRRDAGLTQRQLADLSGLSERAIRDLESGRAANPRRETIRLLGDALRLGTDQRVRLEVAARGRPTDGELQAIMRSATVPPPAPVTPMLGREAEFEGVVRLLTHERHRLVRIVGIAGVGKTTMAMEVAGHLHAHGRTPVFWLSADAQPGHGTAVGDLTGASALLHSQVQESLANGDHGVGRLRGLIGRRGALIVIDGQNERWMPLARVLLLLRTVPTVQVLSTGWASASAMADPPFTLLPLQVPGKELDDDPAALTENPSVQLMMSCLRQVRPELELNVSTAPAVARLCRAFDGLPAALVLAARWSALMSLEQLAELAEKDQMLLALTPGANTGEFRAVLESLNAAGESLTPPQRKMLRVVARLDAPWSIEDLSSLVGAPPTEVARDVYAMLMHGLLRRVDAPGRSLFKILHLVRALQDLTPATAANGFRPSRPCEERGTGSWPVAFEAGVSSPG